MFDSGLIKVCEKVTTAVNGGMPTETLVQTGVAYYGARTISASRYYAAKGANCQIDKLVRVPFDTEVSPDMYVVFDDSEQFRVDGVSDVIVKRDVRAIELTLVRLESNYNVDFTE